MTMNANLTIPLFPTLTLIITLRASLPVSVGGHQRSASVSESDSISTASSVASLSEDVGGQGNKKKRSKSLLKQMKRRMSFTNTKGC